MEVTSTMVEKLAHLARLRFTDAEKTQYTNDLQNMVAFVEKLQEIDTTGVTPMLHMGDAVNALRTDERKGSVTQEAALLNAPTKNAAFFTVPKVIKK
jgi:aspartyl-tRNA(Asn)/glutamyl-tRNA(Gln) amidotransferase subunit C